MSFDLGLVARDLKLPLEDVRRTVELLDAGNTIPFITRYRKDQTGGLDEEQIRLINQRVAQQRSLAERKATILKSIQSQGCLSEQLAEEIREADSAKRLEDLYLPYKPKKRTLATQAREQGLEPLAQQIRQGVDRDTSPEQLAARYVCPEQGVESIEDALQGVRYLLAEHFSEQADLRSCLRRILWKTGKLVTTGIAADERPDGSARQAAAAKNEPAADPTPSTTQPAQQEHTISPATPPSQSEPSGESSNESSTAAELSASPSAATESKKEAPTAEKRASAKSNRKSASKESAFRDYFDFNEQLQRIPPHRILAINRGERAKVLRVKLQADEAELAREAKQRVVPEDHPYSDLLQPCLRDALTRLILPSLERDIRRELTERSERHAVEVFVRNLRNLLLQPPVHGKRILAIDPGFRSGCKLAVLDEFGNVLDHAVIHIVGNTQRINQGRQQLVALIHQHDVAVVAIGNGTACRETEQLVADLIGQELSESTVSYVIVNEAGASVYSTSPTGREELPGYDPTIRSAISIGRRLLDPLSELVKINAANIGVGLYQHDVKAKHLRESLDDVVESCVNFVGVDVNTASPSLLRYVSGLNQLTARRLAEYRTEHGPFQTREQFKLIPGFGEATFVQSAGFLKIHQGENPLDATWIHPESYATAERLLDLLQASVDDLVPKSGSSETTSEPSDLSASVDPPEEVESPAINPAIAASAPDDSTETSAAPPRPTRHAERLAELEHKIQSLDLDQVSADLQTGRLLIQDILNVITRPGRDPREDLPPPIFRRGIMKLEDLQSGTELQGRVLNVVDFGVFVDIGLNDSGLVHISRLSNDFVSDPHQLVSVGDTLKVWVLDIDKTRRRVALTAVEPGSAPPKHSKRRHASSPKAGGPKRKLGRRSDGKQQRPPRSKSSGNPPKKKKPVTPITSAMAEGKEPLRSFSDLKQFLDQKPPQDSPES